MYSMVLFQVVIRNNNQDFGLLTFWSYCKRKFLKLCFYKNIIFCILFIIVVLILRTTLWSPSEQFAWQYMVHLFTINLTLAWLKLILIEKPLKKCQFSQIMPFNSVEGNIYDRIFARKFPTTYIYMYTSI